jgi:glutamyl-Q tRNA(Asp) synthetase
VVAALASYLDARSNKGTWLVRMEDLDPPRESAGASAEILRTLEALGLLWDESVVYQSQRRDAYEAALELLASQQLLYLCRCSRSELLGQAIYPGTCRDLALSAAKSSALRCRVPALEATFDDRLQGHYGQHLRNEVGDFVVRRKDGYYAYQLAVVVDDGWQQITDVVRGIDLLESTPRQLYLQHCLQLPQPRYAHIPVVVNPRFSISPPF